MRLGTKRATEERFVIGEVDEAGSSTRFNLQTAARRVALKRPRHTRRWAGAWGGLAWRQAPLARSLPGFIIQS
jgi:hypothetical protein